MSKAKELKTENTNVLEHVSDYWTSLLYQSFILFVPDEFHLLPQTEKDRLFSSLQSTGSTPYHQDSAYLDGFFQTVAELMSATFSDSNDFFEKYEQDKQQDASFQYLYFFAAALFQDWQEALIRLDNAVLLAPTNSVFHAFRGYLNGLVRNQSKAKESCIYALENPVEDFEKLKFSRYLAHFRFQAEVLSDKVSHSLFDSSLFDAKLNLNTHLKQLNQVLPAVSQLCSQAEHLSHSFFVLSDPAYFKTWVTPLVLSALDMQLEDGFHVHIVNPDQDCLNLAHRLRQLLGDKFSLTVEYGDIEQICRPNVYYSCLRFCRLAQIMATTSHKSFTLIDADMLFNKPVSEVMAFRKSGGTSFVCAAAEPLWNHFPAGFSYFLHHKDCTVLLSISNFILRSVKANKYAWFLDQVAIALAVLGAERSSYSLRTNLSAALYYDLEHQDESFVWAVTNDKMAVRFTEKIKGLSAKYKDYFSRKASMEEQLFGLMQGFFSDGNQGRATEKINHAYAYLTLYLAYQSQFKVYNQTGSQVLSGPFKGMVFPPPQALDKPAHLFGDDGGTVNIVSYLIGSYEAELHQPIYALLERNYDCIVDIGCSQGYYAVGLGRLFPKADIYARDLNPAALAYATELASLNQLLDRFHTGGLWQHADFSVLQGRRALVFCDIEGGELELLQPEKVEELKYCDLIVELHDAFNPVISDTIIKRFQQTHDIQLLRNGEVRCPVPTELSYLSSIEIAACLTEIRAGATPWAVMRAKQFSK